MKDNGRDLHPLNRLRLDQPDLLADAWKKQSDENPEEACRLINDPGLDFPVLFILKDDLESRAASLSPERQIALIHIRNVLNGADQGSTTHSSFAAQHDLVVGSLLWILRTGWKQLLSTDYIQVIDQAAIQILLTYRQDWIREMVDLIVYRYKNRSQRHYLISALMETANPIYLVYMANYLLSDQSVERTCARQFLSFIPEVRHAKDSRTTFLSFETWYEENEHYLVYTGETNDAFPEGRPFRIHHSAKYLGKTINRRTGEPRQKLLSEEEKNYLSFLKMPHRRQKHLSGYSCFLRKERPDQWLWWIERPLSEQLKLLGKNNMER